MRVLSAGVIIAEIIRHPSSSRIPGSRFALSYVRSFPQDLSTISEVNLIPSQPVIPLSMKGYEDVSCRICNFQQPLSHRADVQGMRGGGGQGVQMEPPQNGPPQGWGQGPPNPNQPMRYG